MYFRGRVVLSELQWPQSAARVNPSRSRRSHTPHVRWIYCTDDVHVTDVDDTIFMQSQRTGQ